jgi:hypothetical protein
LKTTDGEEFSMKSRTFIFPGAAMACAFFLLAIPRFATAQLSFTDMASALQMADSGMGGDVIWYDWDGDGDQDLMVTRRFFDGNSYFRNDGDSFTRLSNTGMTIMTDGGKPTPADFDHDGDLDYWTRGFGSPSQLMVNENGVWVDRTADFGIPVSTGWRDADWVDFDHDGCVDLITGHYTEGFRLYRNVNGTHFENVTDTHALPLLTQFAELCEADVNLDGEIELFITTVYGHDYYFVNDGNGNFRDATAEAGLSAACGFMGCKWADFDNDKYPDLLTQSTDRHTIWHNNGDGTFTEMQVHGTNVSDWGAGGGYPGGAMYAVADFNMDGLLDFYAGIPGGLNFDEAPNQFFVMDSIRDLDVWFHDVAAELGMDYQASTNPTAIDYNGDGAMDLCMASTNEPLRLFRNNTPRNPDRLEVQPLGPNGERDRWHTRVEVYPHGGTQPLRVSELNSSNVSRNGFNSYFVLDENGHYDLRLYFACGVVMLPEDYPQLNDVVPSQIGHLLTVRMGQTTGVNPTPPALVNKLGLSCHPNPFNAVTQLQFTVPANGRARIAVYDLIGRHVTDLADDYVSVGEHSLSWNASALSSGVYFIRLEAADMAATQKVALLK